MIKLKKFLGNAGALVGDKSMGFDTLYDVLKAVAQGPGPLNGRQITVGTGTVIGTVLNKPGKLTNFRTSLGTTGTAGTTTVQVHKNGVSQGELSTANTEDNGTKKSLDLDVDCVAGDLVQISVSAAGTGALELTASLVIEPVDVE